MILISSFINDRCPSVSVSRRELPHEALYLLFVAAHVIAENKRERQRRQKGIDDSVFNVALIIMIHGATTFLFVRYVAGETV